MATKADFTPEEWSLLRQGPTLAGVYVSVADAGGQASEGMSIAKCFGDAHERWWGKAHEMTFIDELVSAGPDFDRAEFGSFGRDIDAEHVASSGMARLRASMATLRAKATSDDVDAYRQFVLALAARVAESHKEGRFLGIGGAQVSPKEQQALDRLAAQMG